MNIDEWTITNAVLKGADACPNGRLKQVLASLVTHLHQFAREIQLIEAEWASDIQFLTYTGHIADDRRQEFILLSDTLGLSTLVATKNNVKPQVCTEAAVFCPVFLADAPRHVNAADIANGSVGAASFVSGAVRGRHGERIAEAQIDAC